MYKSKVLRDVAKDARVAFREDGPDFNAERVFDRRDREALEVERHLDKVLLCKRRLGCSESHSLCLRSGLKKTRFAVKQ